MTGRLTAIRGQRSRPGDSGLLTLELVIWFPGLLLLTGLLIVAGRVNGANAAVEQAAADAARTASIARTAGAASSQARLQALQSLSGQGLHCSSTRVTVDTAGFSVPPGQPATVRSTVSCTVRLSDLGIPGLSGSRTVSHTAVSTLDTFRQRT